MPSSVIAHIDYQVDTQVLKVTFLSGAVYAYFQVPDEVYVSFRKARSKGQFLNEVIKENYPFKKLN